MAYYAIGNRYVIQAQVDNHHFDASGTSKAMFDELAERSLMSPLAGTKHTFVRLAIRSIVKFLHFFQDFNLDLYISASYFKAGYISVIFRIVLLSSHARHFHHGSLALFP